MELHERGARVPESAFVAVTNRDDVVVDIERVALFGQ